MRVQTDKNQFTIGLRRFLVSLLKTGGRGHVFNIEESRENHAKCWEQNRRMILIKLTGARWTGLKN